MESSTRQSFRDLNNSSKAETVIFPRLLCISVRTPLLLPESKDPLKNPAGFYYSLIHQNSLKIVAQVISVKTYRGNFKKSFRSDLHLPERRLNYALQIGWGKMG